MNLTDHAGARLKHGKPKLNGVEIHYAIGGAGGAEAYLGDAVSKQLAQVARDVCGVVIPASGHNVALENPVAVARAYLDFFGGPSGQYRAEPGSSRP